MSIHYDIQSADVCLRTVRQWLFMSMAVSSVQHLSIANAYRSKELFDWRIQRYTHSIKGIDAPGWQILFGRNGFVMLHLARLALMAASLSLDHMPVLVDHLPFLQALLLTTLILLTGTLYLRSFLTTTGADQMNMILLVCLTVDAWFPWPHVRSLTVCAMAIQVLFCYVTNGLIKAMQPTWRNGSALRTILQLGSYSRRSVAAWAEKTGLPLFRHLSLFVIIWEVSAVMAPFLPGPALWTFLAIGVVFHLSIALIMGLNTFFWTFVGTYPAILFLHTRLDAWFG